MSRDAERERDELARALSGMRAEQAARSEVQQALEAQRDLIRGGAGGGLKAAAL